MIYLKPQYGLCNRLRAIASGLELARQRGDRLTVVWFRDEGMTVPFLSLMERPTEFNIIDFDSESFELAREHFLKQKNERFYAWTDLDSSEKRDKMVNCLFTTPTNVDFAIETCLQLCDKVDYSWVRPKLSVRQVVETYFQKLGQDCVGIHIRRTDNLKSRLYSPIYLFEAAIDKEIMRSPNMKVFLATDDEEVKERLENRFGARIVTVAGVADRFEDGGVAAGFVDLLLLAKTRRVYGSFWSSFSLVAAQLGKIPCSCLKIQIGDPEQKMLLQEQRIRVLECQVNLLKKSPLDYYIIRFHRHDGTCETFDQVIEIGMNRRIFWRTELYWSRDGYLFLGWDFSSEAKTVKIANGSIVKNLGQPGEVVNLYGVWKKTT